MVSLVERERARLSGLMVGAGPEGATLCAGWAVRDLAAHLVVREGRPDAAAGIRVRGLAGWTERVQGRAAERPFGELVKSFRSGPPAWSPFNLPGVDGAANLVEFFVHAEDVRRAVEFEPEPLDGELAEALWKRVPMVARFGDARSPVSLRLVHPDGREVTVRRKGAPVVTVTGGPGELVLFLYGRGARAAVVAEGEPGAVEALAHVLPLPAA
ncbi:TIGR03085 family metal-binding protein [Kitasatospora sp. NPDC088134]|uniref:TIGR03085 family metal-binding protein n=1 Tax=Kitasatospora sp. NPDC088134 TaxID=3364071 RepID=UPI0038093A6A